MTIYIGNLSYEAGEDDIKELFSKFGEVSSVKLIKDNTTGRSKGFGFVEMADASISKRAISELHETEFMSRNIVVNEARPKTSSDRSSSFGGSRGGNKSFGGSSSYNRRSY